MNKAFNKYGKVSFKSIVPKRLEVYYALRSKGISYKNPSKEKPITFTFGGVNSGVMSEADFVEGLKMIEGIL